jgi:hypothetical protein
MKLGKRLRGRNRRSVNTAQNPSSQFHSCSSLCQEGDSTRNENGGINGLILHVFRRLGVTWSLYFCRVGEVVILSEVEGPVVRSQRNCIGQFSSPHADPHGPDPQNKI